MVMNGFVPKGNMIDIPTSPIIFFKTYFVITIFIIEIHHQ